MKHIVRELAKICNQYQALFEHNSSSIASSLTRVAYFDVFTRVFLSGGLHNLIKYYNCFERKIDGKKPKPFLIQITF